jgi:hypothetical protein
MIARLGEVRIVSLFVRTHPLLNRYCRLCGHSQIDLLTMLSDYEQVLGP